MDTKEVILQNARDLYAEVGYHGFSMRKVAKATGISATAIYRHFENRDALLHGVILCGFRLLKKYFQQAERIPNPVERLRTSSRYYLDFSLNNPAFYQIMFMATDPLTEVGRLEPEDPPDEIRDAFLLHLEYVKAGNFETDNVIELAVTIWAHCHGLVSLHLANRLGMMKGTDFPLFYERSLDTFLATLPRNISNIC